MRHAMRAGDPHAHYSDNDTYISDNDLEEPLIDEAVQVRIVRLERRRVLVYEVDVTACAHSIDGARDRLAHLRWN